MGEHRGVSDDRNPLDRALELLVYAPVGVALTARDMLPGFIERGRQQLTSQLGMARMVGQFAVKQGQAEAEKAFGKAREQAQATLEQLGGFGPSGGNGAAAGRSTPTSAASPPPDRTPTAAPEAPTGPTSGPGADVLAITDYDSLSASQVVPRLSSLNEAELEAVRAYEAAHRGRKTILNKIAQLQQA